MPTTRNDVFAGRSRGEDVSWRRMVVSLTGIPNRSIRRSAGRPPALCPISRTSPHTLTVL
jgi:hypothetical protein